LDTNRIAELLKPFLTDIPDLNKNCHSDDSCHSEQSEESEFASHATLSQTRLENISTYIDLLLRWNARVNLTAVRQPEEIVTRHFGESFFAARHLFPKKTALEKPTWGKPAKPALSEAEGAVQAEQSSAQSVIDLGSGAGFPGVPIKIWVPEITLTLIESNQKKATFLREVTRALTLMNINVYSGRAEQYGSSSVDVVTLRAVERFESILPIAAKLVAPQGRLALLISKAQLATVQQRTLSFTWKSTMPIPLSSSRILAVGIREP
jgi:16S rRNA (guanine527-N7)-methyltransferase